MLENFLEEIYAKYNRRDLVHPDPLEFLYNYSYVCDREIVGLVASSLAYGRVAQILKSVTRVLDAMGTSPRDFIEVNTPAKIHRTFESFKHRFTTGADLSSMLCGVRSAIKEHGSLEKCFASGVSKEDESYAAALVKFSRALCGDSSACKFTILSSPEKGSACKRLNLYLRWMVRSDNVDPNGWKSATPAKLIVPLDTHMYKIGKWLKFTSRKQANMKTALEITSGFRKVCQNDPVKYDFALTRFGIHPDMKLEELFAKRL